MNVALLCSHEVLALVVWLERESSSTVCKEVLTDILFVCFLITDPIDPPVCGPRTQVPTDRSDAGHSGEECCVESYQIPEGTSRSSTRSS